MNRNLLKYIAIIAMLMDHFAMTFFSGSPLVYFTMRFIGRLTAPIMSFFVAEGFYYTHSKYKYGLRLGVFALISQFAYTYFDKGTLFTYYLITNWNVIFTLFIGFWVLFVYEKIFNKFIKWTVIILLLILSYPGDWMIIAPLWTLFFHIFRDKRKKRFIIFSILAVLEVLSCIPFIISNGELWQVGVFFTIPLLLLYNGQKGSNNPIHKWAFYLFYPLHLIVLRVFAIFF